MKKYNFNKRLFVLDNNLFLVNLIGLDDNSIPKLAEDLQTFLLKEKEFEAELNSKSQIGDEESLCTEIMHKKWELIFMSESASDKVELVDENDFDSYKKSREFRGDMLVTLDAYPNQDSNNHDSFSAAYQIHSGASENEYMSLSFKSSLIFILNSGLNNNSRILIIKNS
jgi:hypothetical protein